MKPRNLKVTILHWRLSTYAVCHRRWKPLSFVSLVTIRYRIVLAGLLPSIPDNHCSTPAFKANFTSPPHHDPVVANYNPFIQFQCHLRLAVVLPNNVPLVILLSISLTLSGCRPATFRVPLPRNGLPLNMHSSSATTRFGFSSVFRLMR